MSTRRDAAAIVVLLGLVATSCATTAARAPATTGPPTTASTTSTAAAAGTTTSAPPTSRTCPASALTGAVHGSSGGAGTIETTIVLHNASGAACTLSGYPGLTLLDANGNALTTTTVRGGDLAFERVPPTTVTLAPGQDAMFNVGTTDVPTGTEACEEAARLQIYPPNATDTLIVALRLTVCGGGAVHASPVFPASAATADGAA